VVTRGTAVKAAKFLGVSFAVGGALALLPAAGFMAWWETERFVDWWHRR
jgi:hypothetical protein